MTSYLNYFSIPQSLHYLFIPLFATKPVTNFVAEYPSLVQQIAREHPEYFVDGIIVRACVKDHATLVHLLGESYAEDIVGQGTHEHVELNYWHEYSKIAIDEILKLRLESDDSTDKNNSNKLEHDQYKYLKDQVKIVSLSESWHESSTLCKEIAKEVG